MPNQHDNIGAAAMQAGVRVLRLGAPDSCEAMSQAQIEALVSEIYRAMLSQDRGNYILDKTGADLPSPEPIGRRHSELVARVVSELRGLNFDFEPEETAAERIIEIVEEALTETKSESCHPYVLEPPVRTPA